VSMTELLPGGPRPTRPGDTSYRAALLAVCNDAINYRRTARWFCDDCGHKPCPHHAGDDDIAARHETIRDIITTALGGTPA
jgi:hypothetical protein